MSEEAKPESKNTSEVKPEPKTEPIFAPPMELTPLMNESNVGTVRTLISRKISHIPYYATEQQAMSTFTDQDHFPYTRYYRGIAESSVPIVMEREAGWRPLNNQCYRYCCCCDPTRTQALRVENPYSYR